MSPHSNEAGCYKDHEKFKTEPVSLTNKEAYCAIAHFMNGNEAIQSAIACS